MKFRITTWPNSTVPLPSYVEKAEVTGFHIENGHLGFDADLQLGAPDPLPQFHEAYLRLPNLDLESEKAIVEFVNAFAPMDVQDPLSGTYAGLTAHSGFRDHVLPDFEAAQRRPLLDHADDPDWITADTIEEFRWGAACIMDLTSAWRFVRWGTPPTWHAPIWDYKNTFGDRNEPPGGPQSRERAGEILTYGLRDGLERFGPNVSISEEIEAKGPATSLGSVGLYAYCCLELFNHIVEDAPYKRCRNESCDRLFVRQEGRAGYGQHRVRGVKYCSVKCMNAQSQRRFRRKKAQAS
jgi:hypothetical protein